jgi:hypothetical protein
MLALAIRLMNEYKPLLVKLHQSATDRKPKKLDLKCYAGLIDVQIVLGLACLLPMLRAANLLMKFGQRNDVFVCDYLADVSRLQTDITKMYVEEWTRFSQEPFWDFNALVGATHDSIPLKWITEDLDLNTSGVEYLAFVPKDHTIWATYRDLVTMDSIPVIREVYAAIIDLVKSQAIEAAGRFVRELSQRFPTSSLMDAHGIIYPQYWMNVEADSNFPKHLKIIKDQYEISKHFSTTG